MADISPAASPLAPIFPAAGGNKASQASPSAAAQQSYGASESGNTAPGSAPGSTDASGKPLTQEQQKQVQELKRRDAEVRAHEQAHAIVGGSYASAPSYTYQKGPDGKKYAVGGEVQIDVSPERDPEDTIRKMDVVIRAALAPAQPSAQDRAVARQAQQQRIEAQQQVQEKNAEELGGGVESNRQTPSLSTDSLIATQASETDESSLLAATTQTDNQSALRRSALDAYQATQNLERAISFS